MGNGHSYHEKGGQPGLWRPLLHPATQANNFLPCAFSSLAAPLSSLGV